MIKAKIERMKQDKTYNHRRVELMWFLHKNCEQVIKRAWTVSLTGSP